MIKKFCILVLFILTLKGFAQEEKVITPPVGPFVQGLADFFITGKFLYWKAIQEGLHYATRGVLIQPGTYFNLFRKIPTRALSLGAWLPNGYWVLPEA